MTQHVIVAFLSEPIRNELAQLRSELDIWTPRWLPPHVTIVRPFVAELEPAEILEIQKPVALTAQFVRWMSFRNPGANVVYLEPTQAPFQRLRQDLLTRVPKIRSADTSVDSYQQFSQQPHFHVTLAGNIPDTEIEQIFSKVSQKTYLQVFQIQELSLLSMENEGFWEKGTA